MAKMKLRKKKGDGGGSPTLTNGPTPGNPLAVLQENVERWRLRSKYLYLVELGGTNQAALIPADSKLEAKERFMQLFGIQGTERPITAKQVENDGNATYPGTVAGMHVDVNGVVDPHFDPNKHGGRRPKQDNDLDDDGDA
jgi:hypothetical protein